MLSNIIQLETSFRNRQLIKLFYSDDSFSDAEQIQTSLRLISVFLSNVLYYIYDASVVSLCTLYLNKILFKYCLPHRGSF